VSVEILLRAPAREADQLFPFSCWRSINAGGRQC
jgi:hypothetical protein